MPQMMPMWWEMLMMTFLLSMMSFQINIYHYKTMSKSKNKFQSKNMQPTWKW
uniref:ATP synthase F0 subunit 8 n=1 Tax=Urochelellus acutihumeralis TaxID=3020186 RepID=UPI002410D6D0|nr:ATP synthase F0 subunit 8 [Urochelellus acutihumeralis]WEM32434.1 ATP synthase F0 subunit 8 [Urochelellus acutihumeralis]